jgi:phosphoribosylformimino-5-aminoimidazole carboxamide ribotide isomerase
MPPEYEQGGVGKARSAAFETVPAVDVLDGEAVRLERGAFDTVALRVRDPLGLVERLARQGPPRLHLVDLGAARSGGVRPAMMAELVAAAGPVPVQVGGGVRSLRDAEALLAAGADRAVIGTAAFSGPDALAAYVRAFGERLVVAIDVRDGAVAATGWESSTGLAVNEAVDRCVEAGVTRLLCTAIERDGTMSGPNLDLLTAVVERAGLPVLAAGGIRSKADLSALRALGLEGAVVGRAVLEGTIAF